MMGGPSSTPGEPHVRETVGVEDVPHVVMQAKIEEVSVSGAVLARIRLKQVEVEAFGDFAKTEGGGAVPTDALDSRVVEVVPEKRRDMVGGVQPKAVHAANERIRKA